MDKKLFLCFCAGLLVLEVTLGWRYVGSSMLLGDQLDQLQQFAELLRRSKPQALYGPWMSGTNPIAYNLGPLFSMSLGLLGMLGLNPDWCHAFCMLVIVAALVCFTFVLGAGSPRERCLAMLMAALMASSTAFQDSMSYIWVNLWLPSACLLTAASMLACVRRPSVDGVARTLAVWLLGMHLHSVAVAGLPLVLAAAYSLWPDWRRGGLSKHIQTTTWVLLVVACLPYAIAEIWSNFSNTRAMILHVTRHDQQPGHVVGIANALESLQQSAMALGKLLKQPSTDAIFKVGAVYTAYAWVRSGLAVYQRRQAASDYLWLCLPAVLALQAGYHVVVNRSPSSFHYFIYPTLFYWLPWADMGTAVTALLPLGRPSVRVAVTAAAAALLTLTPLQHLPKVVPDFAFKPMLQAVESLCRGRGPVRGYNSTGFENGVGLAYHTNVAEFLIKNYSHCPFDAHAPTMIVPRLPSAGDFPKTLEADGTVYTFIEAVPPRIGLYRSASAALR